MTLILSLVTKDEIFQVSDRRITQLGDSQIIHSDETNKALFVDARMTFAYTGVAKIGEEETHRWLQRVIRSCDITNMREVTDRICAQASADFRRHLSHLPPQHRLHAFQAVGWIVDPDSPSQALIPAVITIHNGFDLRRFRWEGAARNWFKTEIWVPTLRRGQMHIQGAGTPVQMAQLMGIYRFVSRVVKHPHTTGRGVQIALQHCMKWISQYYPTIGAGGMIVTIPKTFSENTHRTRRGVVRSQGYHPERASFFYYTGTGKMISCTPSMVTRGGIQMDMYFILGGSPAAALSQPPPELADRVGPWPP